MSITAKTYARRKDGSLAVYSVSDVPCYGNAIMLVIEAEGAERALCLVEPEPEQAQQPIEDQEAVA